MFDDLEDVLEDSCVCPIFDPNTDHHVWTHEPCPMWHHFNVHSCWTKVNGLGEPLGQILNSNDSLTLWKKISPSFFRDAQGCRWAISRWNALKTRGEILMERKVAIDEVGRGDWMGETGRNWYWRWMRCTWWTVNLWCTCRCLWWWEAGSIVGICCLRTSGGLFSGLPTATSTAAGALVWMVVGEHVSMGVRQGGGSGCTDPMRGGFSGEPFRHSTNLSGSSRFRRCLITPWEAQAAGASKLTVLVDSIPPQD